jgi:hypothetical protein
MRNHLLLGSLFLVSFGAGCGGQSGTEILPNDAGSCVPQEVLVLNDLDALPEGFDKTPNQVLAAVAGSWQGDLNSTAGETISALSLSLEYQGAAIRLVRSLPVVQSEGEGPILAEGNEELCPPLYEIPLQLIFSTENASLLESMPLTLVSATGSVESFFALLPLAEVVGSAVPSGFDPAEFDNTNLQISAIFSEERWNGEFGWSASRVEESPDGTSIAVGISEKLGIFSLQR